MAQPRTLFDKIWDSHVITPQGEGAYLIYIDLHLIHEVTTPQAFEGLRLAGRKVRRPDATMAVADHNVPTSDRSRGIDDPDSKLQVDTLERNVKFELIPAFLRAMHTPSKAWTRSRSPSTTRTLTLTVSPG